MVVISLILGREGRDQLGLGVYAIELDFREVAASRGLAWVLRWELL